MRALVETELALSAVNDFRFIIGGLTFRLLDGGP